MKLKYSQLEPHLKNHVQRNSAFSAIYIISGDEPLQKEESARLIYHYLKKNYFSEHVIFHLDEYYQWLQLQESLTTPSLFAQNGTIIELRTNLNKVQKIGSDILDSYSQKPIKDYVLLIITNKIDRSTESKKWFLNLMKVATWIPVWPIEHNQLPNWVANRLKTAGLRAEREAVHLIAEKIEGNLLAGAQEIEKLKLLVKNNYVTEKCVQQTVASSAHFDVFFLVEAILQGSKNQIVLSFQGLLAESTELTLMIWAVSREIRFLLHTKRLISNGDNVGIALKKAAKQHKIAEFIVKKRLNFYTKIIEKHSETTLRFLLKEMAKLDIETKTRNSCVQQHLLSLSLYFANCDPTSKNLIKN